jgi:hypothetical protein
LFLCLAPAAGRGRDCSYDLNRIVGICREINAITFLKLTSGAATRETIKISASRMTGFPDFGATSFCRTAHEAFFDQPKIL